MTKFRNCVKLPSNPNTIKYVAIIPTDKIYCWFISGKKWGSHIYKASLACHIVFNDCMFAVDIRIVAQQNKNKCDDDNNK